MNLEYLNPELSPKQRTSILLPQMTIEEKIGQMMQVTCSRTDIIQKDKEVTFSYSKMSENEIKKWVTERYTGSFLHVIGEQAQAIQKMALTTRLGIPIIFGIDAVHGHCLHNGATIFPTQLSMSCSWNKDLIEEMGRVVAREVAADGLHWTFSPILCIGRDLRWGRVNETFGEDPYLIGELGSAIIRGYQGKSLCDEDSILACAKHYIAYGESTGGRDSYDSPISYRKLKEVFLPPFQRAKETGCATFMSGYQSIDGNPATANKKILREILRDELGFKGFIITDWNNTGSLVDNQKVAESIEEASYLAIDAGNDMIMNTPEFYEAILKLVREGKISEGLLDEAVSNILYVKFSMGLFEKARRKSKYSNDIFACNEHLAMNLKLTRESMVLLENKNKILPLKSTIQKIAVIGPNADDIQAQYGDWTYFSHPTPKKDIKPKQPYYTMLEGIRIAADQHDVEVRYHQGCHIMDSTYEDIEGAVKIASQSDVVIAVMGDCLAQNGEFKDRGNLDLSGAQQKLLERLKQTEKPLIVVLVNGKPLSVPWIKENADALIETFNSGMFGGKVVGEILFGETNPSGKLSISFPYHSGQLPVYYNHLPGWHGGKYMDLPVDPLYHFGYGRSYSEFQYENLILSSTTCTCDEVLSISVDVTNVSQQDGSETVQLYVNDMLSSMVTPVKELKGFSKVFIPAGRTKRVTLSLPITNLAIVNDKEEYIIEKGEFIIMVGSDSRDESLLKEKFWII